MRVTRIIGMACLLAGPALAGDGHHGHSHDHAQAPAMPEMAAIASGQDMLPVAIDIPGDVRLIDQDGVEQGLRDLVRRDGITMLFFGYASCDGVCLLALPAMAEAARLIDAAGGDSQPILVTIDPERDTPDYMKRQLRAMHPGFIGLTADDALLARTRELFHVKSEPVFEDEQGQVFQHGSFIYLIDRHGEVVSMLPPVLPPARIAEIAASYL